MNNINTSKYEEIISSVLIDNRENDRVKYALKQYHKFNPKVQQLEYGDYIFIGKNNIKVVFEYKTGADFLNSITEDNHLHNQVYGMVSNFDYTFVIIECEDMIHQLDELYYSSGVSVSLQQIDGAISEYSTVSTVLHTQTQYQAFDLMMRIAGKIILNKPISYKFSRKSPNSALTYLTSIKGLNNKAYAIVKKLDLHTLNDLLNLTVDDLTTVEGIGKTTAEKIIKQIK